MPSKKTVAKAKKVVAKKVSSQVSVSSNKNGFIKSVQKRDGTNVPFDIGKIVNAINKAMLAAGEGSIKDAEVVAKKVQAELELLVKANKDFMPTVESIQDSVEKQLMLADYVKASKDYILYREERARLRSHSVTVPEHVKKLTDASKKYFRNPLSEFVYYRSYAKWIEEEGRRETWIETVDRYINFMKGKLDKDLKDSEYEEIRESILKQEAMPSMRLMQFAGAAAEKTNVCAYNCSFIAPASFQDFGEIIYISMCGTGVGFSIESKNIQALPQIKMQSGKMMPTYVIPDTKEGWADALAVGMKTWADARTSNSTFLSFVRLERVLKLWAANHPDQLRSCAFLTLPEAKCSPAKVSA